MPARTATTRRPLSAERVVAAALEVADAEGVEAVTMRRLAEALDVHPTSLYNHVPTKEAILDGMADALIAEAEMAPPFDSWQDWVRAMAVGLREVSRAHPGAFLVLAERAATGPVARDVSEAALDALRRGGFSVLESAQAAAGVSLTLLGLALNECPPTAPFTEPDISELSPERYPRLRETIEVAPVPGANDGVWDLIVESLITGLTVRASGRDPESRESGRRRVRPARR